MNFPWLEAHGGITHFPVALLIASLVFDIGAAVFRKPEWRTVGFWMLATGVVMALPALFTGWMTARHLFSGPAQPPENLTLHWRAAVLASALAAIVLTWRVARRDTAARGPRAGMQALGALAAVAVGFAGYLGGNMALSDAGAMAAASPDQQAAAREAVARNRRVFPPDLVAQGHKLVVDPDVGCRTCHRVDGAGGKIGPDLSRIGLVHPDIAWQVEHLRNPRSVNPNSSMPAFDHLSARQREAIAAWLVTQE